MIGGVATASTSGPPHTHRLDKRPVWMTAALLTLFNRYIGVPQVIGRERIPKCPFMICANHRSHMDSLALICGLGLSDQCALLAARDYFVDGGPWRRLLALPFTVVPVERVSRSVSMLGTIKVARAFVAKGGQALISFPEGTRRTESGIGLDPGTSGAANLYRRHG